MKLNEQQIAKVLDQTGAAPVPDDHSAIPGLRNAFGDHTFYMAPDGLCVLEPVRNENGGGKMATAMIVATWADEEKTELRRHEPQPTEVVVALDGEPPTDAA